MILEQNLVSCQKENLPVEAEELEVFGVGEESLASVCHAPHHHEDLIIGITNGCQDSMNQEHHLLQDWMKGRTNRSIQLYQVETKGRLLNLSVNLILQGTDHDGRDQHVHQDKISLQDFDD